MLLAHTGHWLINVFYMVPVIIVVGFVSIQALRDRRAQAQSDSPEKKET